jgi:ribosomal protein S18 acetylase RimI-like enzyme
MPILEQLSSRLIQEFKTVRLRALRDSPSAFGSTYGKESQLSDEDWLKRATTWNSNGGVCYIGMDKSEPCGIIASFFDKADPQKAHVASMWVAPAYRRTGLGTTLMDAVERWARGHGAVELRLMVTSNNSVATAFYQRLGYIFTGNTEPYPNDPALVEYEMVKYLRTLQDAGR